jgi:hypothetical protein
MILETTCVILGTLVLYHIYRSLYYGQDFIGDFFRSMLDILHNPLSGYLPTRDPLLRWRNPGATGVTQRRVGTGAETVHTMYTVVGPRTNGGVGVNEWTPPMGAPIGIPAIGSPTDPNALPLPPQQDPEINPASSLWD